MQTSLDGFVSTGPDDDQTWVTWALEEIKSHVLELFDTSDTILIGRKLAVDYIPFREDTVTQPEHEMFEMAKRIVAAKKIVFTKNTRSFHVAEYRTGQRKLTIAANMLRCEIGKNLIVYCS